MTTQKNLTIFMSIVALTLVVAGAVDYVVINTAESTPGGARFNNELGADFARQTLRAATDFTWQVFDQSTNPQDRKPNVAQILLIVSDFDKYPAFASGNKIYLSSRYIGGYSGDLRREISGIIYHEIVHIWQWNGNGEAPSWLIEGIADFVRLKAGFVPPHWLGPGAGDRWDDRRYEVAARFLDFCNSLRGGFVAELNRKMRTGYPSNDSYFVDLLGKSIDQLWNEYKAIYAN